MHSLQILVNVTVARTRIPGLLCDQPGMLQSCNPKPMNRRASLQLKHVGKQFQFIGQDVDPSVSAKQRIDTTYTPTAKLNLPSVQISEWNFIHRVPSRHGNARKAVAMQEKPSDTRQTDHTVCARIAEKEPEKGCSKKEKGWGLQRLAQG